MTRWASDSISIAEFATVELTPADQGRDWRRRWNEIERRIAELGEPRGGPMSGEAIHASRGELHAFYVQCYHLKDALVAEGAASREEVEDAITKTPPLALIADLANLDKHAKLDRPPRSGAVPRVGRASASSFKSGWRLDLAIGHAGAVLDGLQVADEAVAAWRNLLTRWQLL